MISRALLCVALLSSPALIVPTGGARAAGEAEVFGADLYRNQPAQAREAAEIARDLRQTIEQEEHFGRRPTPAEVDPATSTYSSTLFTNGEWIGERDQLEARARIIEQRQARRKGDEKDKISEGLKMISQKSKAAAGSPNANGALLLGLGAGAENLRSVYLAAKPSFSKPGEDRASGKLVVDDLAWAISQAERNTPAGHVLAPRLEKLGANLQKPLAEQSAVKQLRSGEASDRIQRQLDILTDRVQRGTADVESKNTVVATAKTTPSKTAPPKDARSATATVEPAPTDATSSTAGQQTLPTVTPSSSRRQAAERLADGAADAVAAGYALALFDHPEQAQVAFGVAELLQRVSFAVGAENVATSVMAGNYMAIALGIKQLLVKTKQPESPFPKLFEAIARLSQQINQLGIDLHNDIARVDARLGAMLESVVREQQKESNDLSQIRAQLNVIERQLDQFEVEMNRGQKSIADLITNGEDADCIRYDGEHRPVPPRTDFFKCRDLYVQRAVGGSRGVFAKLQLGPGRVADPLELRQQFPFSTSYDQLAYDWAYPGQAPGAKLPDPRVWIAATGSFLTLLNNAPDHLRDIELVRTSGSVSTSPTVDPMIDAGKELLDFYQWTRVDADGLGGRVDKAIDDLAAGYGRALDALDIGLLKSGMPADVTRDVQQDLPAGSSFNFQKGAPVRTCNAQIKPEIHDTESVYIAGAGEGVAPAGPRVGSNPSTDEQLTDAASAIDMNTLQPSPALAAAIHTSPRWLELLRPEEYRVEPCLRRLEISHLNMNAQPRAGARFIYEIWVRNLVSNKGVLVQVLQGEQVVEFGKAFEVNLILRPKKDKTQIRGVGLVTAVWAEVRHHWPTMRSLPLAEEDQKNFERVTAIGNSLIGARRREIRDSVHLNQITSDIERARLNLATAVTSGADVDSAEVESFVRALREGPDGFSSPAESVDEILTDHRTIGEERARLDLAVERLRESFRKIVAEANPSPAPDDIADRIRELERIIQLRRAVGARAGKK